MKCPTCGGSFEALADRPGRQRGKYICATRRRKPGVCTNTLTLPIVETDNSVLDIVEGEVLASPFIEELLAVVDKGEADDTARLTAERDRLQREIDALLDLVASGVAQTTVAAKIKEREVQIAKLDAQRRRPRPTPPNIAKLREALTQRAEEWKTDPLRAVRRPVGAAATGGTVDAHGSSGSHSVYRVGGVTDACAP